ncbi:hypothetical protein BGX38DRAFT_1216392, partial [Terfezia claveryi]
RVHNQTRTLPKYPTPSSSKTTRLRYATPPRRHVIAIPSTTPSLQFQHPLSLYPASLHTIIIPLL